MHRWLGRQVERAVARGLVVLGVFLATLALAAAGGVSGPLAAAQPHDTVSLSIQIPVPGNDGVAQGPVGTNLTITGSGLTDQHTYQLGFAPQSVQCGNGVPTFSNATVTPSAGAFTSTVKWPASAANVGGEYYICALDTTDTTQPPVQSADLFRVVAAAAPTFTLQDASSSKPTAGPPYNLHFGTQVIVSGHNFAPGGLTLVAYLSQRAITSGNDLDSAQALSTANSTPITTQDSGDITATIQLPAPGPTNPNGDYLYLVSNDRQGSSLPSLMAFARVRLTQQPTPTPSPSPSATPKVTPTPPPPTHQGLSAGRIVAIVGLSLLSVVLLIVGVLVLTGGPRRMP
jgi:hypothetical protein